MEVSKWKNKRDDIYISINFGDNMVEVNIKNGGTV